MCMCESSILPSRDCGSVKLVVLDHISSNHGIIFPVKVCLL